MGAEVDQSRERGVCNVPRISQTKTTQPNIKIKWRGVKKKNKTNKKPQNKKVTYGEALGSVLCKNVPSFPAVVHGAAGRVPQPLLFLPSHPFKPSSLPAAPAWR